MSQWETREAIRETINGYSHAAGQLDIDALLSFFLPDAEVLGIVELLGLDTHMRGHQGIRNVFGPSFEALDWLMQMNTVTRIELSADGRSARTSTNLVERAQRAGTPQILVIARYEDELVLTDMGWKFRQRRLVPLRMSQVPD